MTRIYLKNEPAPEAQPQGEFRFPLGRLGMTASAQRALSPADMWSAIARHIRGDWGDVSEDDKAENELSLREGLRLLSAYRTASGEKFWIITEADRSATTVLLPEDY